MGDPVLDSCPNRVEHTPCPDGYIGWHRWAARMYYRGHRQKKCTGCGRYAIWVPTPPTEDRAAADVPNQGGGR